MKLKDMRKALVALGVVALEAVHAALVSGGVTLPIDPSWTSVIIALVGAALVYAVRNGDKPKETYHA